MSDRGRTGAWGPVAYRGNFRRWQCAQVFLRFGSPRLLALSVALALVARVAVGDWSWLDLAVVAALIGLQPFHEWLIHVGLLHRKPTRIGPLVIDLPTARIHRAHHRDPMRLDLILLPTSGLPIILALIAGALWVLTWPLVLVGGFHVALFLSAALCGAVLVAVYEWCHFLIHSPYRPRSRYFKAIWRSHRLHHFKNEHFWFGVSSDAADRVLGTNPDHRDVPRSRTARNLAASRRTDQR